MSGLLLTLADTELLPDTLQFLHVGWFIVHLVAIPVIFYIGWKVGRKNPVAKP